MLKIGGGKRRHETMVLESGRVTQLGKWIQRLSCAKGPLEVCGHIIKVDPS